MYYLRPGPLLWTGAFSHHFIWLPFSRSLNVFPTGRIFLKLRDFYYHSPLHCRLMCTDTCCRYISPQYFIYLRFPVLHYTANKFMYQMRMRSMMPGSRPFFRRSLRVQRIKLTANRKFPEFFWQFLIPVRQP